MHNHFLDTLSIEFLFILTFLLMVLMLEVGFQFGQRKRAKAVKAQTAQVRALMGATLGLLAFMLAFTFSGAQQHFESRIQFQIDEAPERFATKRRVHYHP
jgi:Mn2+/Fe2+ NRAMP family transporter